MDKVRVKTGNSLFMGIQFKILYKSGILILLLFMAMGIKANNNVADTTKERIVGKSIQRLSASYVFGAQIYNNDFVYNPGMSFEFSQGFMVGENVAMGLGAGYMGLENENFIPMFIDVVGYQKKKNGFMKFQGGYSHAWSDKTNSIDGYDMNGGLFVDFGLGKWWNINNKLSVFVMGSYRHQFAVMKYEMFGGKEFRDAINYDMLVLTIGLINRN